jgi:hypothetical protein
MTTVNSKTTATQLKEIEANLTHENWHGTQVVSGWHFFDMLCGKMVKVNVWIEGDQWVMSTDGLAMSPHCQNDSVTDAPTKTKFHPRFTDGRLA